MERTDSSLVYSTSSLGELLLTAIPRQPTDKGSKYFGSETGIAVIAKQECYVLLRTLTHLQSGTKQISVTLRTLQKAWFHTENYNQTCVQRSPLENGKLNVLYRVTTIIIYTRVNFAENIRQLKIGKLSSDHNIKGDRYMQSPYIEV